VPTHCDLRLPELGGRELNAFMALLIQIDARVFAAWKMALNPRVYCS
jgi:hypothetical protein